MIALDILRAIKEGCFTSYLPKNLDKIDEAIKELEELQSRSCSSCKFGKFGKFGVDSFGVEVECSLNWECNRGHIIDRFEAKGE